MRRVEKPVLKYTLRGCHENGIKSSQGKVSARRSRGDLRQERCEKMGLGDGGKGEQAKRGDGNQRLTEPLKLVLLPQCGP